MKLFNLFKGSKNNTGTKAESPTMFEVKERCGILVNTFEDGYLWLVAPFWDDSQPVVVTAPDKKIKAIVVINTQQEGCLPLTSFFAMDKNLPVDQVFVLNKENPHDWHQAYAQQDGINSLLEVKQLPEKSTFGELELKYRPGTDFVEISMRNPNTYKRMEVFIGLNLFYLAEEEKEEEFHSRIDFNFIGNFDTEKLLETHRAVNKNYFHTDEDFHIYMVKDWIHANHQAVIQALNHLGHTVYSIGKDEV